MRDKSKQKKNLKRGLLIALIVFLIMVLVLIAAAMIFVNHMLNKIPRIDPDEEYTMSSSEADAFIENDPDLVPVDPSGTGTYPNLEDIVVPQPGQRPTRPSRPEASEPTEPTQIPDDQDIYGEHLVNILLVGQDRREGQGRQRSDTMILVSINKSDSTITLTSFMRDMYVQIPGYKPNKLNAAYAFGGMQLLGETLELNFGVKVDGVVEVDFGGFEEIIDLLGGVRVTLNQAEAKYLNDLYDVKLLDSPVVVGENLLDARQARVYVQLREIDSDYQRTNRQRKLLTAIIEAYRDQPLDRMLSLLNQILPMITTDMTNAQILGYAMEVFPMISSAKINTLRLPLDGAFSSGMVHIREGFYAWLQYNIDFEAHKAVLFEIFRRKD